MDRGPSSYPPAYSNEQGIPNPGYGGPENAPYAGNQTQNQGYPMQNPGYASGPGPVYTTTAPPAHTHYHAGGVPIMVAQTVLLGPQSSTVMCPRCKVAVTSCVRREPGMLAWMSCGFLAIIGCVFGCCLIPFCIDECQDVHHTCPQCQTYLGKYSRIR